MESASALAQNINNAGGAWLPQWVEVYPNELWRADLAPSHPDSKTKCAARAYCYSGARRMLSNELMSFVAPQSSRAWSVPSATDKQWAAVTSKNETVQLREVKPRKTTKPGAKTPASSSRESSEMSDFWDDEDGGSSSNAGGTASGRDSDRIAALEETVKHLVSLIEQMHVNSSK